MGEGKGIWVKPRYSAASFGKFMTTCVIFGAFSLANIALMNLLPSMLKTLKVVKQSNE